MIYFIQAGGDGPIKIGYAQNSESRRKELQTGNHKELSLIGEIPGNKDREDSIHNYLQDDRYRAGSEWFKPTPKVLDYIDEVTRVDYKIIGGIARAIIWRNDNELITDYCPFCGDRHNYSGEDGLTEAGCSDRMLFQLLIPKLRRRTAKDDTVLKQSDGYIVRTRKMQQ